MKITDILKKGQILKVKKLTKKQIKQINEDIAKMKIQDIFRRRPISFEELHKPMDI